MKTKAKNVLNILIILCIIIATILLARLAWAKYITLLNGNSKADIAKWSIKVNNETNEMFTINLADTRICEQEAEIQNGYIGPGTSGEFIIEVDATGTEVSLEYNINMEVNYSDNQKFPQNLIFYSDPEMTNAIYHTDTARELKGFIAQNDKYKKISHTIYWKWDFETGQTQEDRDKNDESDSWWIGKKISIPITVVSEQVNQNPFTNQYAVTFDANGGSIAGYGNSEKVTKMLYYDEIYGKLLIPVRDGYEFNGWRYLGGKNVMGDIWASIPLINNSWVGFSKWDGNKLILDSSSSSNTVGQYIKLQAFNNNRFVNELTYTYSKGIVIFSFTKDDTFNQLRLAMNGNHVDAGVLINLDRLENGKNYTISYNIDVSDTFYSEISNIQIEEGLIKTEYEPYYITNTTKVFIPGNHTVSAKWIQNET